MRTNAPEPPDGIAVFGYAMVTFIRTFLGLLDPAFVEQHVLNGRVAHEAAHALLESIVSDVQSDRTGDHSITAGDLGGIVDRIAWLCLGTRYPDIFGHMTTPWSTSARTKP